MSIISISLNDSYIKALDSIQEAYDLKGRSEAIRASISAAMDDIRELEDLSGLVEGVLIIVRGNHADPWMIQLQAKYQSSIKTQMHSHLKNQRCLEVMVISCDAYILHNMIAEIKSKDKADYVKFVHG
ncbi:NikR family transcriptional regulator [methanogenic archaeon mixed culture ISO4-G1]|nr:NikR family transcriptional regulator [methanogenic archaeon mixed culture ISO4-G1]